MYRIQTAGQFPFIHEKLLELGFDLNPPGTKKRVRKTGKEIIAEAAKQLNTTVAEVDDILKSEVAAHMQHSPNGSDDEGDVDVISSLSSTKKYKAVTITTICNMFTIYHTLHGHLNMSAKYKIPYYSPEYAEHMWGYNLGLTLVEITDGFEFAEHKERFDKLFNELKPIPKPKRVDTRRNRHRKKAPKKVKVVVDGEEESGATAAAASAEKEETEQLLKAIASHEESDSEADEELGF